MTKAFSALVMDILRRNIPLETAYKRYVSARVTPKFRTGKKFRAIDV